MASRKEHKEKLRREREERERAAKEAEQRRRLIGYGAAGVLVVGALVALALVFLGGGGGDSEATADLLPDGGSVPEVKDTNLRSAAEAAGCEMKSFRSDSRDHANSVDAPVRYKTNPPAAAAITSSPPTTASTARRPRTPRSSTRRSTAA